MIAVMIILFVATVTLMSALIYFFVRSFRHPEKVLKPDVVEQLEARGRKPRNYLRFWRVEILALMLFVLILEFFFTSVLIMGIVIPSSYAVSLLFKKISDLDQILLVVNLVYAWVMGIGSYIGRGYYLGKWSMRFIAIPQGEPPGRTGTWRYP